MMKAFAAADELVESMPASAPMSAFDLPRPASRAVSAAQAVERRIVENKLPPGTRLGTRRELADMLGVAPSTLSESIKLLEDRGLVVTRTGPGGGVFAAEPTAGLRLARSMMHVSGSPAEAANALAVRDILETAVIINAAEQPHDQQECRAMLAALAALDDATDMGQFYRRNLDFHAEVAALCGNELLGSIYRSLVELVRGRDPELKLLPGQNPQRLHTARVRVHTSIARAIVSGDVGAARAAAAQHARRGHAQMASGLS